MLSPATSLTKVTGIGPRLADKFGLLGISTVAELLYYLPRAWEDLSQITEIADLTPDGEKHTIRARLTEMKSFRSPHKRMHITQATFADDSGKIRAVWFNQPYLASSLSVDNEYFFTGKVEQSSGGLSFGNPTYEPVDHTPIHSGRIIAVYPETLGIGTKVVRRIMLQLREVIHEMPDSLPESLRTQYNLIGLAQALETIHFPKSLEELQTAKDRLGFDELLTTQLAVSQMKRYLKTKIANPIPLDVELIKTVLGKLPFQLTASQKRALWEILQDLALPTPTNRLLEGDVGSGKTIVAAIAMIEAAKYEFAACLMAPTEVLALQHYRKLLPLFESVGVSARLRTRTYSEGPDDALISIGTHALLQSGINFDHLNLVIVDEQHRFGVKQREALKQRGRSPHFISLTATPIPRSLALTIFGDLDLSILSAKPLGRLAISTQIVTTANRAKIYALIKSEITHGRQAYVVAPVISATNKLSLKSAEEIFEHIKETFPNTKVGLLHGRLSAAEKTRVLTAFANNEISILVATTVIEVGIDVPNATIMLIEQAERFGLAQLHQLRGRVGRGSDKSYCFVSPETADPDVLTRLDLFCKTLDGFKLAELDLELRGPGSLFGAMQSGFLNYRLANWTDAQAIKRSMEASGLLLDESPDLAKFPSLAASVAQINLVRHSE